MARTHGKGSHDEGTWLKYRLWWTSWYCRNISWFWILVT
jgi:hypothetical protein